MVKIHFMEPDITRPIIYYLYIEPLIIVDTRIAKVMVILQNKTNR
ncbi:hypothetical protein QFZ20_000542 [Flavobacterium sp. W4I14]|nr:hypothetical protein [Flavobacterium sp. W4I14]